MKKNLIIIFCFLTLLVSCFPINTTDAEEAYSQWARSKPTQDIQIIKGEYHQTAHFSLEYEFFLKFKPTKKWWKGFLESNSLKVDSLNSNWTNLTELPKWFKPSKNSLIFSRNDGFDRSRYFIDTQTGIAYIYESVGM
ncbi:hypothetical protein [Rufibacter sp. LB8]|uniref:hypothetical protein n=1 Tax=Rufibacter sp. LB8 TaxID=2777781 RepID=UPI00178C5420|nr:hypothetical protein [Rufibacter sp. LB8]